MKGAYPGSKATRAGMELMHQDCIVWADDLTAEHPRSAKVLTEMKRGWRTSLMHELKLPRGDVMDDSYWQMIQPKIMADLKNRMQLLESAATYGPIQAGTPKTENIKDNLAGEIFAVENDRRDGTKLAERMKILRGWVSDHKITRSYDGERKDWFYKIGDVTIPVEDGGLLNDTLWAKLIVAIDMFTKPAPEEGLYGGYNT